MDLFVTILVLGISFLGGVVYAIGLHKKTFKAMKIGMEFFVTGIGLLPMIFKDFFLRPQYLNLNSFWRLIVDLGSILWLLLFIALILPRWRKKIERQFSKYGNIS